MLKITEYNAWRELEPFKAGWNNMLLYSHEGTIFSTWEWLSCWWEHFGNDKQLKVLIITESDEILCIAPLMRSTQSFLRLGQLNKIEFVGTPKSDYTNVILVKRKQECLNLLFRYLFKQSNWNVLELRNIQENTFIAKYCNDSESLTTRATALCPYILLPDTIEKYLARLSRNFRKDMLRRQRRLIERHSVTVSPYTAFSSIDDAMNVFFNLHQKRRQNLGKESDLHLSSFQDFHRAIAKNFAKNGWLFLYVMFLDSEPAAAIYAFRYNNTLYGYQTGFDPQWSQYGVLNLLRLALVKIAIHDHLHEYDFLRGSEAHKYRWTQSFRRNMSVSSPKGFLGKIYHRSRYRPMPNLYQS